MARWIYEVNLRDVFHADIPFQAKRDEIVRRLRASKWVRELGDDIDLAWLVEDLADAADADEFDLVWRDLYDAADEHRCWIATR
jgi:hypothetical protein